MVEHLDIREHIRKPAQLGIFHRAAAPGRETIAGDVDHVDIARTVDDAFVKDCGAFVDQVDGAVDDLLVGHPRDPVAELRTIVVDDGIGMGSDSGVRLPAS